MNFKKIALMASAAAFLGSVAAPAMACTDDYGKTKAGASSSSSVGQVSGSKVSTTANGFGFPGTDSYGSTSGGQSASNNSGAKASNGGGTSTVTTYSTSQNWGQSQSYTGGGASKAGTVGFSGADGSSAGLAKDWRHSH